MTHSPEPDWMSAARAAGWLPPGEAEFRVWRAHNMNRDSCRWCGAIRAWGRRGVSWAKHDDEPRPHRPSCRFYDGPVEHRPAGGHFGTFDYWVNCACGRSYPLHDADGKEQECPDREMTWRHPKECDLMADHLRKNTPEREDGEP